MRDLLLPRTDSGVVAQLAVAAVVLAVAFVVVRRDRELRLLVVGVAVMTVAWCAARSLH
jgi:hypothetical protein